MQIGGFQKVSFIDYPGKISAIIFTQGCNFNCPYCHNTELVVSSKFQEPIPEEEIISFLIDRKEKLQGVVITGGEPSLQKDLIPFLYKIKEIGFNIKLDTNGSRPSVVKECIDLKLVDYIAMDIKGPFEKYSKVADADVNIDNIKSSINMILNSGIDYMFRTTVVKPLLTPEDIAKISSLISGGKKYILQNFVYQENILDSSLLDKAHYSEDEFFDLQEKFERGNHLEGSSSVENNKKGE